MIPATAGRGSSTSQRGWSQITDALSHIASMEAELATALGPRRMSTLRRLLQELQQTMEDRRT